MSFECLQHPPYSPDLAPSDFHIVGPLKEAMGGKSFRSDEEVQQAVHEWLHSQPKDFFSRGIHALPKRWNTCMEHNADYVEKLCRCVPYVFNKLRDKNIYGFRLTHPRTINTTNLLCYIDVLLIVSTTTWISSGR